MGTTLILTNSALALLYLGGLLLNSMNYVVGFFLTAAPIAFLSAYIAMQVLCVLVDIKKPTKTGSNVFAAVAVIDVLILVESYFYWNTLPLPMLGTIIFALSVLCFVGPAIIVGLSYIAGPVLVAGIETAQKMSDSLDEALPEDNKL